MDFGTILYFFRMKKLFYFGVIGLALFEFLKVYFIMPLPRSQEINALETAYFLHTYRWAFRILLGICIVIGAAQAFSAKRKWLPILVLALALPVVYLFNFKMIADHMFRQPEQLIMKNQADNALGDSTVIIGVALDGSASAYPLRYLVYHHQVQDTVGSQPVIVTYCSVCRTGRVYKPEVNGRHETFRLVGMDHYNAMFEDATTHSWWRQVTGEAIMGKLKGAQLPEVSSEQMTLGRWFALYPQSRVMQADEASIAQYDSLARFEWGRSKGSLTRTDSLSWKDKSWVVGIQYYKWSKAYDWNRLKREHLINDKIEEIPVFVVLASDGMSFGAFVRPSDQLFMVRNDSLISDGGKYDLLGRNADPSGSNLVKIPAYQEFWHSWRTFHPETLRD